MAVDHYENFPVASWLMPAALRPAVRAVYAFARSADDFADAGDLAPAERLTRLAAYGQGLTAIAAGLTPADPVLARLALVIAHHQLSLQPFHALLSAFRQDVLVRSYPDRRALLDYCRRSADPVGRIMLALWRQDDPSLLAASDAICTALQLVNFLQDVTLDAAIPRLYLPLDALARHGLTSAEVLALRAGQGRAPPALCALILEECAWTRDLMRSGAWLPARLGGRIGLELGLVVAGGLRILERIEAAGGDVVRHRPVLGASDWPRLAWRAWVRGFPPASAN
ncbi:MAG: squalene synthase HpnC [Pseudomonadota bacterium]|nr:squalene synthase HpnC [Pseudomonadota bacterium]